MTINELIRRINKNTDWVLDEYEDDDFQIRLIPLTSEDGEETPFLEVEAETEYGEYDTMYFNANGQPISLCDFISREELKKYNIRDREGMAIPKEFLSFLADLSE